MKKRNLRFAGARLAHLSTRLFDTPLLIEPRKLDAILSVLGPHLGLGTAPINAFGDWYGEDDDDGQGDTHPDGVAIIRIAGTLVKRSTGMDALSGLVPYGTIQQSLASAIADDACSSIVLDIDSPGGEASGMFECADYIRSLRGIKPIIGCANDSAYSAAYCLASACDHLFVTNIGGVGSIGCYLLHCDQSEEDKQNGLKYTYIKAGAKKTDGNPHEPLSDSARSDLQARVDRVRDLFVQAVAANRSVDALAVYDTEAGCFSGPAAVPMLADAVGTLDDAVAFASAKAKTGVTVPVGSGAPPAPLAAKADAEDGDCVCPCDACSIKGDCENCTHEDCDCAGCDGCPMKASAKANRFFDMRGVSAETAARLIANAPGKASVVARRLGTLTLAGSDGKHQRVTGLLAPYESQSCDLGNFKEVYERGCFGESLKQDDPRVLFNHNPDYVLGRQSAGTARFWEEPDGLHYEADLPDTQAARDLKVLLERGDISGSSAAFYILSHRWEQRGSTRVRVIEKAQLVEGGPHSFAAYGASTAESKSTESNTAAAEATADYELELIGARLQLLRLQ